MSDDEKATSHVPNRRKRRRTLGSTWMDNTSNLPDLASLFSNPDREVHPSLTEHADALLESGDDNFIKQDSGGYAEHLRLVGVRNDNATAHIQTRCIDGVLKGKAFDEAAPNVVEEFLDEEVIDLIDYEDNPFAQICPQDYLDIETESNNVLLHNNVLPTSVPSGITSFSQESCEVMEVPPRIFTGAEEVREDQDIQKILRSLRSSRKLISPWYNLLGFVTVCGSVRYTVMQYNLMREILHWVAPSANFPSYSTVQRTLFPHALKQLFPRSELKYFVVRRKKKAFNLVAAVLGSGEAEAVNGSDLVEGGKPPQGNGCPTESTDQVASPPDQTSNVVRTPVRIVSPSEWAKLDVMMAPFFNAIYPDSSRWKGGAADADSIERTRVIAERQAVTEATRSLYVSNGTCNVQAFPGSTVRLTLSDLLQSSASVDVCRLGYRVHENESNHFVMKAIIAAVWCVGSEDNVTRSAEMAARVLRGDERLLARKLATAPPLQKNDRRLGRRGREIDFESRTRSSKQILPGDICTLLRPHDSDKPSKNICLLVSRFWRHQDGLSSDILFWFENSSTTGTDQVITEDGGRNNGTTFRLLGCQNLKGQPFLLRQRPSLRLVLDDNRRMQKGGRLMDGTKFVVYRVLLYCDDFSASSSMYPQGSAGGCYMLPLGLPPRSRNTRSSVRIIGLTPPGVSTNSVLLSIIPDLVKCTKDGVEAHTPSGEKVRIFIDVVGFVADYPAAAETLDVMGHTANTPCTLCVFRKNTDPGQSGYGYSTTVHSHRSSSLRCRERHEALRGSAIDSQDSNRLGMKDNDKVNDESSPLLALQRELERVRADIPLTKGGKRVVSGRFDAYRCNVVAPDHLLAGLAKNVIEICFFDIKRQGDADAFRAKADLAICRALRENGLIKQSSVFSSKNELNSMTLSGVFCVLLVCVPVFKQLFVGPRNEETTAVLNLLRQFQELVSLTYWWPSEAADGLADCEYVTRGNGEEYHADLQERAEKYVVAADRFCAKYCQGTAKGRPSLDKPNLHRLLELYQHTIPAFGHVRHFMELVFENAHQPLKRCIIRGNHQRGHVSAVDHCLGNDWQGRLALLACTMKVTSDPQLKMDCKRGLRRLLLGEICNEMQETCAEWQAFAKETDVILSDLFVKPLMKEMRMDGKVNPAWTGDSVRWESNGEIDLTELKNSCIWDDVSIEVSELLPRAANVLENLLPEFGSSKKSDVRFFSSARRVRRSVLSAAARTYSHDTIVPGCVVQVMLPRGGTKGLLLNAIGGPGSSLNMFAVVGILQRRDEIPHAVVVRCRTEENKTLRICADLDSDVIQVLSLTDGVRRVALYHACSENSCSISRNNYVKHSSTVLGGGTFHFQTRKHGYPPRMA